MSDKNIITQPNGNGKQPTIEARAFTVAFVPDSTQPNITQTWSLKASEAINCLIDFRSSIHRWMAQGKVDEAEFTAELQRLEDAGLAGWIDELIAQAMMEALR